MSRTITAMFDSRADAELARERLGSVGVSPGSVSIIDQSSSGFSSSEYSSSENKGFWATLKDAFLPDEDRHTYEEGVRRGHYLLTAQVEETYADEATRILDDANSIDIEDRSSQWKSSGWQPSTTGAMGGALGAGSMGGADYADRDMDRPMTGRDNEAIPIVEEQLVVGKREVGRGTVRVRSYVTERPVTEQVTLRDEHVDIERRPVTSGDVPADAFRERSIEMTETQEEAVVSKQARVVEEVVLRKEAGVHTETVTDTVRRTDVEVERDGDRNTGVGMTDRGTTGFTDRGTTGTGVGSTAAGLGNEAVGNVKQGLGSLTGSESLRQDGAQQERHGEAQQGERKGY